jgi:TolA-binding protein
MDALKHVLHSHANSAAAGDDALQGQFEQAVLLFVQGQHAAAAAALQRVQAGAEAAGRHALAGDACKWLGHAHLKLGDMGRAAGAFAAGCEAAEAASNKRLQVCAAGS